jgi:hypothetical protein
MVHGGNLLRSDNCGFATYECRTVYDVELADNQWKRAEQSMACQHRENQLLMKQRDEARERIKRLEAVTNDPHALWANWLRGSVALPAGIGDVRQYQDRIKRFEEAGDAILNANNDDEQYEAMKQWRKAKEAKL